MVLEFNFHHFPNRMVKFMLVGGFILLVNGVWICSFSFLRLKALIF